MEEFDKFEKEIWEHLSKLKTPEPSSSLKANFYEMLSEMKASESHSKFGLATIFEKAKAIFKYRPAYNWAYGLVLAILTGFLGYYIGKPDTEQLANLNKVESLAGEVKDLKQMMMLSLLENPMATERMKAVSYSEEISTVDDKMIDALLMTLNHDEDENVRLLTVEALTKMASNPRVRKGLVQSISIQTSPLLQVALADAMVKLQEKSSIKPFEEILKDQNTNSAVKDKIEKSIQILI